MRLLFLAPLLLLGSCRLKSPVERHWLRVPAPAAGDLSSIQRAQWLKEARPSLPARRELKEHGHLLLPATGTLRGSRFASAEVQALPGAVAIIVRHADTAGGPARLHLLSQNGALYQSHPVPGGPDARDWRIEGTRITGYRAGGPMTLTWDGARWR